MSQKLIANWLKTIIIGIGVCGLLLFGVLLPTFTQTLHLPSLDPLNHTVIVWLTFLWIAAIPCYAVLVFAWKVASHIGNDRAFSIENAKLVNRISVLAAADSVFFFLGNIVLLIANMNHPVILLASFIIIFIGIAISVAANVLSHLIMKAQVLQEQSDFTI